MSCDQLWIAAGCPTRLVLVRGISNAVNAETIKFASLQPDITYYSWGSNACMVSFMTSNSISARQVSWGIKQGRKNQICKENAKDRFKIEAGGWNSPNSSRMIRSASRNTEHSPRMVAAAHAHDGHRASVGLFVLYDSFLRLTAGLRGRSYYWQRLTVVTVSLVYVPYPAVVDVD